MHKVIVVSSKLGFKSDNLFNIILCKYSCVIDYITPRENYIDIIG